VHVFDNEVQERNRVPELAEAKRYINCSFPKGAINNVAYLSERVATCLFAQLKEIEDTDQSKGATEHRGNVWKDVAAI